MNPKNPISIVGNVKDALVYISAVLFLVLCIFFAGEGIHYLYHYGEDVATCRVIGYLPDGDEALLCIVEVSK